MFKRIFAAFDRLAVAVNGVAERFEEADRQLAERIGGKAEVPAIEGGKAHEPDGAEAVNGRPRQKAKAT